MPGGRKVTSRRQAGFMGRVIAGKAHAPGLSKAEAKDMTRGVKVKRLPVRSRKSR